MQLYSLRFYLLKSSSVPVALPASFKTERLTGVRILHFCDLETDRSLQCEVTDCAGMKTLFI